MNKNNLGLGMKLTYRKTIFLTLLVGLVLMLVGTIHTQISRQNRGNELWQIISKRCVPSFNQTNNPAPCLKVDKNRGYALFKASEGAAQYLLLPLQPITGIESEHLLSGNSADYLALAWQERQIISKALARPIDDNFFIATINSVLGRSQNQLHVHLSCLRQDVVTTLAQLSPSTASNHWQSIRLRQHNYLLRLLSAKERHEENLLQRISREIPDFRYNSSKYGVALTALKDGTLVLLVVKQEILTLNFAHPEELQDNQCKT